ncbi:pilus assembly protein PilM [Clostridium bornimense]|uniref:pilus assembly protein PilM n=1 Tax=Clostridium bornimense TaxID=1216932 RepID=UPI001C11772B|nr:pilus assembly protein PilM [Clostridium bornimense]
MAKKQVSVELGNTYAHVIVGSKNSISDYGTITVHEDQIRNKENLFCQKEVISALGKWLNRNRIREKDISFIIQGSDIITRYIEVPVMKEKLLMEAIQYELSQFIPEMDRYYTDYEILDKYQQDKKNQVYRLLLVAVPREKMDRFMDIVSILNMDVDTIDILSNSMARVIKNGPIAKEVEDVGVFNFGARSSNFFIMEEGMLKIERTLIFGTDNLTKDVEFGAKEGYILGEKLEDIFYKYPKVKTNLDNALNIIAKTIQFYNSGKRDKKLSRIIIISDFILIDNLIKYMESYFGTECLLVRKTEDIGVRIKIKDGFHKYIGAYGMFLRRD